ncbi:ABC transporter, partial [Sorangium cellulosum]
MSTYAIKRLLSIIPTLFIVATLVFILVRIVPGGPFDQERAVPVEVQRQLDAKYHLNDPVLKQYGDWLFALVTRGDLGPTFKYPNRTVNEIIALSLPVSMQLGFWAMLFALAMGIPLGIVGAIRQNTWKDTAAMGVAMVGLSVPRYVLAPLLMLVFSLKLYWFPVARWETWRHMVLPVICAGLPVAAYIARLTRGGMLEVIRSDFIRTARAKGLSERKVVLKHALRGGLLPVVSFLGPGFSGLLVGSLVVEKIFNIPGKIFNIPGMGRYFVEAATNRDYNLVMGVMLVYGFLLMLFNALVDVAYAFI